MEVNGRRLKMDNQNPFSHFVNHLSGKFGQGTLADEIGVDPSIFSKWKSGQPAAVPIAAIDKMFAKENAIIVSKDDWAKLENALEVVSDLWKFERQKNGKR
jgi:hypothetical protein